MSTDGQAVWHCCCEGLVHASIHYHYKNCPCNNSKGFLISLTFCTSVITHRVILIFLESRVQLEYE